MDIVKAFSDAKGMCSINIQGTPEDPLFQANQIGSLLGLVNIRETIKDFDEDEKDAVSTTDSMGRNQTILFLTELGLYRLLGMSRKPCARPFQKWVAKTVKEIRLTGKYELEQRLEIAAQDHRLALEASNRQLDERQRLIDEKEAELVKIRTKIYEELPKLDNAYINKEVAELASDAHKIGKAIDSKKREAQLNTGSAQGSKIIHIRPCHNAKIVEDIVKVALKRYHIASIGGEEHYNNNVEHSVDIIDIAATVVDTLASSFEYMTRRALFDKVIENLTIIGNLDDESIIDSSESLREDTILDIVDRFLTSGPDESRSLKQHYYIRYVNDAMTEWYAFKKVFEAYMLYKNPGKKWELLTEENGPFIKLGYDVVRTHICRGCLAEARSGCCINYSPANRSKRFIIKNMELVSEDIIEDSS